MSGAGRLAGKVAIVTGAGNGMGAAEAALFAREGAQVVVTDLRQADAEAVAATIVAAGGKAVALRHDVASKADWAATVALAVERFGGIDVLVNNAGIHPISGFEETGEYEWDLVQAVNGRGAFLGTQAVLPSMKARGGGSIVNISSIAARLGMGLAHYSAAKAGVVALTRVTAVQYGPAGIRANAILPGVIETDMIRSALDIPGSREGMEAATPLRRVGRAEDVAAAALFLASDEAAFVSGVELVVDGAFSLTNTGGRPAT